MNAQKNPKTVLVTGGSGFIGGMTCKYLVEEAGHNVINLDRSKKDVPGVTTYPFDLSNHQVRGVFEVTRPDTVIHLAGASGVAHSFEDPAAYYQNNVVNSIMMLNVSLATGVKNFIFGSSASVYGGFDLQMTSPSEEKETDEGMWASDPYGRSKYAIEKAIEDYESAYDMKIARMRYFNAAGASPDGDWGQQKDYIITKMIREVLDGKKTFPVYKSARARDYTHVADIALANLIAMNYLSDGGDSQAFNIGRGVNVPVKELIKVVSEVTGEELHAVDVNEERPGDLHMSPADITRAKEVLGWEPQYDLEDIVQHAYNWESR